MALLSLRREHFWQIRQIVKHQSLQKCFIASKKWTIKTLSGIIGLLEIIGNGGSTYERERKHHQVGRPIHRRQGRSRQYGQGRFSEPIDGEQDHTGFLKPKSMCPIT